MFQNYDSARTTKSVRSALHFAILLLLAGTAHAQWQSTTYTLKGGWNAIYLSGDATYDTIDAILPNLGQTAGVVEIWRWNPNPTQVQFTSSPLLPTSGTPEWSVWKRGFPLDSNLTQLIGQTSYLVKCTGTTANVYTFGIKQTPKPPSSSWVRNGANLFGFPTFKNGADYPLFSSYFATFPAAIAANTKIYKYVGGDLGAGNPVQVFSPSNERLDRTQAYWFSAEVVGDFTAPLEITTTASGNKLAFGNDGTVISLRVRNRTAAALTLTLAPIATDPVPVTMPAQTAIVAPVPLTKRTFNTGTQTWTATAITASYTEALTPNATTELYFGIDRTHATMTSAATGAFFASLLRLTESSNLVDVYVPATATKTSLAGLWIGDISVTDVNSKVSNVAKATATKSRSGIITALSVSGTGGFGYTTAPAVVIDDPVSGTTATAAAIIANGKVTGFTMTNAGSGYERTPAVTIAPPPPLTGTSVTRSFPLRTLLHVADDGTATLLSKVFLGQLATSPYDFGVSQSEASLKQDAKATAKRFVAAHMPLNQAISAGTGSVVVPGVLTRTITVPYNDATNPFVHQYHPDHDNLDARFNPVGAGVESYSITRACTFTFTSTPPVGSTVTAGWGSSVIGGTYSETLTGLHKQTLQVNGTFELRRASEIGTLTP